MKVNTQPYKGARDFYPEDKRRQKWMFDKWRRVAESFGYEEYDAPILEPTDLFLMKGSEEIIRDQTYTFKDRGDRSVTMRTEMTPSVSRMVAGRRQELAYPARWYSIPNLWRYERMQRGRLREFWQLNIDIFGVTSTYAEIEIIQIADGLMQEFKANRQDYVIKLNSRVLVNTMFEFFCELNEDQTLRLIHLTDKKNKMSKDDFTGLVDKITGSKPKTKKVIDLLNTKSIDNLPKELKSRASVDELTTVLSNCRSQGIRNIEFDITLMRGFDYYTDIVFEVFDTDPENSRSMFGGGRYDGLVGQFGSEPVATVGFGMGDVTFMNFLESHQLLDDLSLESDVAVLVKDEDADIQAQLVGQKLRDGGINVAIDYSGRKLDKQLKAAAKSGVSKVLFIGSGDTSTDKYTLKDLKSGKEQVHTIERIIKILGE